MVNRVIVVIDNTSATTTTDNDDNIGDNTIKDKALQTDQHTYPLLEN